MVFKILRAGRKIHAVHRALENEHELKKYHNRLVERAKRVNRHPLMEDFEILKKEVEWLRFSEQANLYIQNLGSLAEKGKAKPGDARKEASPYFASIEDILMDPEKWSGKNVIIDGELEFYNRNKLGERWHIFNDGSGVVTAVSYKELREGSGTLFGIAHRTSAGRQVFMEIKNFHPI